MEWWAQGKLSCSNPQDFLSFIFILFFSDAMEEIVPQIGGWDEFYAF